MTTDNPFEIVLDRLRERGWWKGDFWRDSKEDGPYCIRGAAASQNVRWDNHYHLLEHMIETQYQGRLQPHMDIVANFNDHPATTFADVERVLEKAAVRWEEERVMRDE